MTKEKIVLGIESSCDETACALVNDKKEILSSVVWSQYDEHRQFGGLFRKLPQEHIWKNVLF